MTADQKGRLDALIETLTALPSSDGLMNPYASAMGPAPEAAGGEIGKEADRIRIHNLRRILSALVGAGANVLCCGEAPGHLGARFSGYAFSSEREIIQGRFPFEDCRLLPAAAAGSRPPREEPSALYMWRAMARRDVPAVFHNACPLHPHEPGHPYTNRKPTREEVRLGGPALMQLVDLVQPQRVIAVGRTAERALRDLGIDAVTVRHPSYGGAPLMMRQLEQMGVIDPPPPPPQIGLFG